MKKSQAMIPSRLGPEELGPGRAAAPWGRTESRRPEQGPDRRRAHPDAELPQLAFDPDAAPAGVLPGEAEDERTELGIDRRPSWATDPAVRPLPLHELAVPTEEGCRGDEEGDPAVTRDRPARRREEDPVDDPEPGWPRRPLQHPELMAEDEDLDVLRMLVSAMLAGADDERDEATDEQVEKGPHQPIVPR